MLNCIWAFMLIAGIIYGAWSGNMSAVSDAVLDSSVQAVELVISMAGIVAMWCGIMEIADNAGIVKLLSRWLRPVVLWLLPGLRGEEGEKAVEYITINFIMNMLGTGWSATGPGLMAMEELDKINRKNKPDRNTASDEMCTFLVLNISSLQLVPVNIIAFRRAYGAVAPASIVLPALIATGMSTMAAVLFCKAMCLMSKGHD